MQQKNFFEGPVLSFGILLSSFKNKLKALLLTPPQKEDDVGLCPRQKTRIKSHIFVRSLFIFFIKFFDKENKQGFLLNKGKKMRPFFLLSFQKE